MRQLEAVILAGGLGTRLRPVVSDLPKPMAPVAGRPFLEYLLDFWLGEGVRHFIFAVGYKYEAIVNHFGFSYQGIPLDYSIEEDPVGTGGGLFLALEKIQGNHSVLVINGDTFFPVNSSSCFAFHQKKNANFTIVLREMSSAERYGTVQLSKGSRIEQFYPPGEGKHPFLINGGVYLANPIFLKRYSQGWDRRSPLSSEKVLFPKWIQAGEAIYGFRDSGDFIDIGIPEDYERCQNFFKKL